MGKGSKPKIEITYYYMSIHYGICAAADALLSLIIKEKPAWSGEASEMTDISISQRELFGGDKKEGGAIGSAYFLPGADDQVLPDELATRLGRANGADCPGFRGLASVFFHRHDTTSGFYWTANTPYLPGVWAKVRRILTRADGSAQWYPEKAPIPVYGSEPGDPEFTFDDNTWRYLRDADAFTTDEFSAEAFDDSGWATGLMPFGDEPSSLPTDAGFRSPPATEFAVTECLHLRRTLTLDAAVTSITFDAFVNKAWQVWINGVSIFDEFNTHPDNQDTRVIDGSYFRVGDNTIYIRVRDIHFGAHDELAWMDLRTATIVAGSEMNPAHIIRECLTDTQWGMGTPTAAIDDVSFTAAADTLFDEQFGLSLMWTRQAAIQDFVREILDHIQGVIYVDPSTGLITIALIRDDYDAETLDTLTPDNADLKSFSRKLWGDIVNEIVVTWTNPENEQEETISVQDDSSIAIQGGQIISDSRNYYGVRHASLAKNLAMRDLRSAGQPLAAIEAEADRSQFALRPASVIKVTWPEYGLSELVMRVQSVDYGKPGDMAIKLSLVEDVYGLDIGSYDEPPSSAWVDPSAAPEPLEDVEIITLPLYFAQGTTVAAFVESPEYPEVLAGVLATDDSDDTFAYELWDEVVQPNGDLEWQSITVNNIIGRGVLADALEAEAESINVLFDDITGQTSPIAGGFAIIGEDGETGNEIALIDADNGEVYGFDLARGVLDTIPRSWPAGTPVWFVDSSTLFEDTQIHSAGETVSYKLLSRTSLGLLDLGDAPLESYTLTERPWLPNRPANVIAYGEAWSSEIAPIDATARPDPWVTVSWAIRNRLDEDTVILAWADASMTAESGQTTTIEVRAVDGTLLDTHDGLAGTTFDVPDASFADEVIVELRAYSERSDADGDFVSLQFFSHWVQVALVTADIDSITADSTAWTADEV